MSAEDSQDEPNQFQVLQDHIDELTREKFELRRGLEQQQGIAAALASENQRLLDDYNQQVVPFAIDLPQATQALLNA